MTESRNDIIELRSEEVQELMGQIPPWILQWGITIVGILLTGLLVGSYFFRYPDTLTAEITVTTDTPPLEFYTRQSGRLMSVNVATFEHVDSGTVLTVIESTSNYKHVDTLAFLFSAWQKGEMNNSQLLRQLNSRQWQVGDMQPALTAFVDALNDDVRQSTEHYYSQKIDIKKRQFFQRRLMEQEREKEYVLHRLLTKISEDMFCRDSTLFKMKLISEEDYNSAELSNVQSRLTLFADISKKRQSEMEQLQDNETMLDLQQQSWQHQSQIELALSGSAEQLENAIRKYEQSYVMRSPVRGIVNMMGSWRQNQFVDAGQLMMIVLPDVSPISIGRAKLPAAGAGKVKVGQIVRVRLSNYPYSEYGYVEGLVCTMSAIPDKESNYFLEISFPNGLLTNYGKKLPHAKQMIGTAEIMVKDKRLINHLLEPIRNIFF